ncbi:MAG TPA: glycerophosphodiester phosphodiesterase [Bacillota bacterium]|nr:glycerophosphodiester phosphodiesterase [Bacillota bacterium]
MNTIKIDKYFKGMVANRGLSGIETENTIFAFLAAANRTYFGISGDLDVSKDGKIIITADDTLLRLGLLNLYIPSFNYEELKKFSLVDRKTTNLNPNLFIPQLGDMLAICQAYRKSAFLSIKSPMKHEQLDQVLEVIEDTYNLKSVYFISEDRKVLQYLNKKIENSRIFIDVDKMSEDTFDFCKNNGFNAHIKANHVSVEVVKRMHLIGLKVGTGVVNDKDLAEKLIKHDVDYVFTDILE